MRGRSSLPVRSLRGSLSSSAKLRFLPPTTSIVILGDHHLKVAQLFVRRLESAGLPACILADWGKAPTLLPSATLVIIPVDRYDSFDCMTDICRQVKLYAECPMMIVLSGSKINGTPCLTSKYGDVIIDLLLSENVVDHIQRLVHGSAANSVPRPILEHGDLVLEHEKYKVTVSGNFVALTPSEYKLLHTLMSVPGRVFLREELLNVLYDQDETVVDRVIDVHIGKVRKKIEKDPAHPQHILTVRGVGYKFSDSSVPS